MSLPKIFADCTFAPCTDDEKTRNFASVKPSPIGTWKTTSFFVDSSGRSSFTLPLQLTFSSKKDLDVFLDAKCLQPPPKGWTESKPKMYFRPSPTFKAQSTSFFLDPVAPEKVEERPFPVESKPENKEQKSEAFLGFEVKSYSVDETKDVIVERVKIQSSSVENLNICFLTEITVRATNHHYEASSESTTVDPQRLNVLTNLEITPILTIKKIDEVNDTIEIPDIMALELGAIPDHMQKESTARVHEVKLPSMALNVTLTHAFTISVRSMQGVSLGNTLVALTICHSNSHSEPVTISNIALHPGHSRYETSSRKNRGMQGAQYSVTNMIKSVQWGYVPKTELSLPLTLNPQDAYSTVLTVNAGEEMHSRSFISPLSVTGAVGQVTSSSDNEEWGPTGHKVVVAAEASWSTELVAVEPVDAFRIETRVEHADVKLGEPIVVALRIFNLGLETRDLMLLMAKDDLKIPSPKDEAVNTAVVSEVDGYTFGVWGIAGEDDGTVRLVRDNELLAVDAALLLGEVKGQHAVDAQLRFVPLREGTLKVPTWKLYDKSGGKWYTCAHNLCVVAKS